MTKDEILELAKSCGFDVFSGKRDDESDGTYWECWEEQLIEFAIKLHLDGWREGYKECLDKLNPSIEDLLNSKIRENEKLLG